MSETRRHTITVHHYQRVPEYEGDIHGRSVQFPSTQEVVEVSVDWDAISIELGRKAAKNKSRKSVELGGLVVVKHLGPARLEPSK